MPDDEAPRHRHTCPEIEAINAALVGTANPYMQVVEVERYAENDTWRTMWGCFADHDETESDGFYTCAPITFCPFCGVRLEVNREEHDA